MNLLSIIAALIAFPLSILVWIVTYITRSVYRAGKHGWQTAGMTWYRNTY